ncbi:MAG: hypothetical protein ACYC35_03635 [Pirellulales bacterium]
MKAKISVDKAAIKGFFVNHAEKLVLAVVILLFGGWVYSGVRQPTFDKTPQDLQAEIATAKQHIEVSKLSDLPAVKEELAVKSYRKMAAEITKPIPKTPYMFVNRPRPVDEDKVKRGTPLYYAIEDIQVAGGMGAFAINSEPTGRGDGFATPAPVRPRDDGYSRPAGGRMTRPAGSGYPEEQAVGKKGAVRRPKKPGKKEDTSDVLTGPSDYGRMGGQSLITRGVPVPPGSATKYKFWAVVTGAVPAAAQAAEYARCFQHLPAASPQSDNPEYRFYRIERAEIGPGDEGKQTAELTWQSLDLKKALAERKIWATVEPPEVVAAEYVHPRLSYPLGPLVGKDWDKSVAHPKIPLAGADATGAATETPADAPQANPDDPFAGSPEADASVAQPRVQPGGVYRRPEARGYDAYRGSRRGGMAMPSTTSAPAGAYAQGPTEQAAPYYLFRFFDFTVEPGKRYRYRVRLVLDNPNKDFAPVNLLAEPATAKVRYGESPWSETSLVTVPRASSLLAGSAKPAVRSGDEPSAEVVVRTVDVKKDTENVKKVERIFRGEMANYSEKKGTEDIRYQTDLLLCDVRGGSTLPVSKGKTALEPAELIFLDADGRLVVQSETSDSAEFQQCLEMTGEGAKEPGGEDPFGARILGESSAPAGYGRRPPGEVSAPAGAVRPKAPRSMPRGG